MSELVFIYDRRKKSPEFRFSMDTFIYIIDDDGGIQTSSKMVSITNKDIFFNSPLYNDTCGSYKRSNIYYNMMSKEMFIIYYMNDYDSRSHGIPRELPRDTGPYAYTLSGEVKAYLQSSPIDTLNIILLTKGHIS
jgi:hypothetical protein